MKNSKNIFIQVISIIVLLLTIPDSVQAQFKGLRRTDLQQHDLSTPGLQVIQTLVEIEKEAQPVRHKHPGEEIVYVTQGLIEYQVEGKAPVTLKAGQVLFIPAGVVHSAKNVGKGKAAEVATYIVEKGKPLLVLVNQ